MASSIRSVLSKGSAKARWCVRQKTNPSLTDAREHTCMVVARELLARKGSDETGLESLVALTASIGSFSMTCVTANTFGIDPPAANQTPLAE